MRAIYGKSEVYGRAEQGRRRQRRPVQIIRGGGNATGIREICSPTVIQSKKMAHAMSAMMAAVIIRRVSIVVHKVNVLNTCQVTMHV